MGSKSTSTHASRQWFAPGATAYRLSRSSDLTLRDKKAGLAAHQRQSRAARCLIPTDELIPGSTLPSRRSENTCRQNSTRPVPSQVLQVLSNWIGIGQIMMLMEQLGQYLP